MNDSMSMTEHGTRGVKRLYAQIEVALRKLDLAATETSGLKAEIEISRARCAQQEQALSELQERLRMVNTRWTASIRSIQRREGNFECFATVAASVCDQTGCCWRERCLSMI